MTFGRAVIFGAGLSLGMSLMGGAVALLFMTLKRASGPACPVCGTSLPDQVITCSSCGSQLRIQAPRVRALGKATERAALAEAALS